MKKQQKTAFVTNLEIDASNAKQIIQTGKLRWKIENEGFNEQKNGGYKLEHKMSRTNFNALQNFMHCLQIAHLINQLLTYTKQFKAQIQKHFTIKHCWEQINAFLTQGQVNTSTQQNVQWAVLYP